MTGFFCQDDYLNKTAKLSDQEVGRLFRALMKYHATGEADELVGRESVAFDFIKDDIDRAEESYAKKCKQASDNRRKGIQKQTINNDESQRALTDVNGSEQYKEHNKEHNKKYIEKEIVKEKEKRFAPPSLDDVKLYCAERNNGVDPQRFIDFYSSKGWKVGNQPMKDWKASVRTWEGRDKATAKDTKTVVAQQYPQREPDILHETPEQMLERLFSGGRCG